MSSSEGMSLRERLKGEIERHKPKSAKVNLGDLSIDVCAFDVHIIDNVDSLIADILRLVAEWGNEDCMEHSKMESLGVALEKRWQCLDCWKQLRKGGSGMRK